VQTYVKLVQTYILLLLRWEYISYHIMQCAAHTPTVTVGIGIMMYFLLMRWECISYHIMQCAAHTPTVTVGIGIMNQCKIMPYQV
jgi:hypothetical protein